MTRAQWVGTAVLLALTGPAARAAPPLPSTPPAAPPLTLSWALRTARQANPEVRALAAERAAAWERVPQAWSLEDPSLAVQLWNFPFTRAPGAGSMVMVQLSQPLPFPGKRSLRGEVAGASARVAGENVRLRQLELAAEVKKLYYQLWVNRAARELSRRNAELLEQLRKTALARVATGAAGVTDVLRIETEQARLRTDLSTLRRDREVLAAAGRQRPELRAAGLEAGRAESQTALARRNRYPDFMPMLMYMHDLEMGPGWSATLGASIPLWSGQKQGRAVREASAMAAAARARQEGARLEVARQVREARASATSAAERLQLLRAEVIPRARVALQAIRADYVAGRESLTALLDGRRVLQDLELELERARAGLAQAAAELERAVGGALP